MRLRWQAAVGSMLPLVATLLGGCASSGQVADQVVKSNLAQESAQNQLLLLNIVRAYQRRPMHFTQISAIRLPVGIGNPTLTVPTPWGPDFTQQIYNISTAVAIQQGVDTTVMNSQEFTRGITTPLPPSLMLYYLDQGWPQQMVLHLFVREIEVYQGKKRLRTYVNYPESPDSFLKFSDVLENLHGCDFEAKPLDGKAYGPMFDAAQLKDVAGLAAAKTAELSLEPRGDDARNPAGYQFVRSGKGVQLVSEDGDDCKLPDKAKRIAAISSPDREKGSTDNEVTATFVLRSPEAMIYYLGEIGRAQLSGRSPFDGYPQFRYGALRSKTHGRDKVTLFSLNRGAAPDAAVAVNYEGETYWIPKGSKEDRSTHALSLLTQILGLQNKGTDLPSTANVRVVP